MDTNKILAELDAEIAQLTKIRTQILASSGTPQRGRPKGSAKSATKKAAKKSAQPKKRTMSAEGKAKIAAAQKARWAKQKKAAKSAA